MIITKKETNNKTRSISNRSVASTLFLMMAIIASDAWAFDIDISARFSPDPTRPDSNKFENTTPVSGYCQEHSTECELNDIFSLLIPMELHNSTAIMANHSDPRQGAMFKLPTSFITTSITNDHGDVAEVKFRISGFGAKQNLVPGASVITGGLTHRDLWSTSSWANAPAPCTRTGVGYGNDHVYQFFWKTPSAGECRTTALFEIPKLTFSDINLAYELTTPNPLKLTSGNYSGKISFTVGPGQDFDFGDVFVASDSIATFNFKLSVDHILNIQFPPGADRLALIPDGGWQQWLLRGRRPEKLFANQSFQIWSSSTFKMLLQCQYPVYNQCGIQNEAGDLVPVETRVTLPTGMVALSGMAVNRHLLSNSNPSVFYPSQYVDNGRAALHFEVSRDSVAQMTSHAGTRYSGNVTIVWDSEL